MSSCGISGLLNEQFAKMELRRIIRKFDLIPESPSQINENVRRRRKYVKSGESKKRASKESPSGAGGNKKRRRRWEICLDEGGTKRASEMITVVGSGSTSGLELEKQSSESLIVSSLEREIESSAPKENLEKSNVSSTICSSASIKNGTVTGKDTEDLNLPVLGDSPSFMAESSSLFNPTPVEDIIITNALPLEEQLLNDIVKDLVNGNLSAEVTDFPFQEVSDGFFALQEAIVKGSLSDADAALHKGDYFLNDRNHCGQTPLHLAVVYGENEIVRLLLKSNADISIKDEQGETALHLSIQRKEDAPNSYECFKELIESKEIRNIINTFNNKGFSPLHMAAIYGAYEEARCLLKKGAEVNLKDRTSGRTALFHAVEQRNLKFVNLLLNNGADVNAKNMSCQTPLMAAKILGKVSVSEDCKSAVLNKYKYFNSL